MTKAYTITLRRTVCERAVVHITANSSRQATMTAFWNHQALRPEWHRYATSDVEILDCRTSCDDDEDGHNGP